MKLSSPKMEQGMLLCLLETRSKKIRVAILQDTEPEDFGLEMGIEVRSRIDGLMILGKPVGRAVDVGEDPSLSTEAQRWITATPKLRQSARKLKMDRINYMIRVLKTRRKIRAIHEGIGAVTEALEGRVGQKELDLVDRQLETMLTAVRAGDEKDPILHLGKRSDPEETESLIDEILEYREGTFLPTGIDALDNHLTGWERGNLVTLSAPRSGGKTMVAGTMGIKQYLEHKLSVCHVSMEMGKIEILKRLVSNISVTPHDEVRNTKFMENRKKQMIRKRWNRFIQRGRKWNIEYSVRDVKEPGYTPYKMASELAPLDYDVIYIDYITLFDRPPKMDTWQMHQEYSKYLKMLAKKLKCVIVILTQLSDEERVRYGRAVEENTDYWIWWNWDRDSREFGETPLVLEKARHAQGQVRFRARFNFPMMELHVYGKEDGGYMPNKDRPKTGGKERKKAYAEAGEF